MYLMFFCHKMNSNRFGEVSLSFPLSLGQGCPDVTPVKALFFFLNLCLKGLYQYTSEHGH